jgi:hypothetical protein
MRTQVTVPFRNSVSTVAADETALAPNGETVRGGRTASVAQPGYQTVPERVTSHDRLVVTPSCRNAPVATCGRHFPSSRSGNAWSPCLIEYARVELGGNGR